MIQPPTVVPQPRSGSNLLSYLLVLAAIVAVGGIAFAVGRVSAPTVAAAGGSPAGSAGGTGQGGEVGRTGGFGGGFGGALAGGGELTLRGTVQAVSATGLTLKLANGTTVQIPIDGSTVYHREASAASSDVTVGGSVAVGVGGIARGTGDANPGSSPEPNRTHAPNETPDANRTFSFGTAKDVTVLTP